MKIENEFTVNAPLQQAWDVILDLERIAPCLPGASIEESTGEEYLGTMAVKLGAISARYRGTVKIEETDEENHRAVLRAEGKETRGQGSASATITSTMKENNGATQIHVETDMQVAGRVAQFGRGIMQDVAEELLDRFSTCVEQEIVGSEEPQGFTEATEQGNEAADGSDALSQSMRKVREAASAGIEPLDLGDVSRKAVFKRAMPILAGLACLIVTVGFLQTLRRPSFSMKFEIRKR